MSEALTFDKIYWKNNPIIITNNKALYIAQCKEKRKVQVFTNENLSQALVFLDTNEHSAALIEDKGITNIFKALGHQFTPIIAAGGVVRNENDEILLIQRRGLWDLPKGKLEANEEIPACAVREVEEETGLTKVTLQHFICNTYHLYNMYNQDVLKTTYWYSMKVSGDQLLIPQLEEDITASKWVKETELELYLQDTFETIRDVLTHPAH